MQDIRVAVVSAEEARQRDALAIGSGIPSFTLMQNAGRAAASVILRRCRGALEQGAVVYAGPGNNGGDGWIVAGELAKAGVAVHVVEIAAPKTPDAITARKNAQATGLQDGGGRPGVVVDALLGTGSVGAPTGAIAQAVSEINAGAEVGSEIIALDIPSGLDATTGEFSLAVHASHTLSFGTLKRGQLVSRAICGSIDVLDIGLGGYGSPGDADLGFASPYWVLAQVPRIAADAHKGTRKRLAIIAGDVGMAGAAILAGKGALRSGVGLLHLIVARENRDAVHSANPAALVSTHDELKADPTGVLGSADALVIGPGLKPESANEILKATRRVVLPTVLDAGALAAFGCDTKSLSVFCGRRPVVLTPHPAEMGKLLDLPTAEILAHRFEVGARVANDSSAVVLLKGTPTVVSSPSGRRAVSASGTPALATGGSGDILTGIVGTLFAQTGRGFESAVCGAWVHGRGAERCGTARGVTLDDILFAMPAVWRENGAEPVPPIIASLPRIA